MNNNYDTIEFDVDGHSQWAGEPEQVQRPRPIPAGLKPEGSTEPKNRGVIGTMITEYPKYIILVTLMMSIAFMYRENEPELYGAMVLFSMFVVGVTFLRAKKLSRENKRVFYPI